LKAFTPEELHPLVCSCKPDCFRAT